MLHIGFVFRDKAILVNIWNVHWAPAISPTQVESLSPICPLLFTKRTKVSDPHRDVFLSFRRRASDQRSLFRRWKRIPQTFQSRCEQTGNEDEQRNRSKNTRTWVIRSKRIDRSLVGDRLINDYHRTEDITGDREKNIFADSSNQSVRFDCIVGVLMDKNIIRTYKSTVRFFSFL